MKTVIIEYSTIAPDVLKKIVTDAFLTAICTWKELDEDYFEFTVFGILDLAMLEDVIAEYM